MCNEIVKQILDEEERKISSEYYISSVEKIVPMDIKNMIRDNESVKQNKKTIAITKMLIAENEINKAKQQLRKSQDELITALEMGEE